jgi:Domain of unknown function (DUF1905)
VKQRKFKAEVLAGHKEDAVEVPFNPAAAWGVDPQPLWRGRRGHPIKGKLNGRAFESFIVPRQKRFFMLIDDQLGRAMGISEGDIVEVAVEPQ